MLQSSAPLATLSHEVKSCIPFPSVNALHQQLKQLQPLTCSLRCCLMASSRLLLAVSIWLSKSFRSISSFFLAATALERCFRSSSNSTSSSRTCMEKYRHQHFSSSISQHLFFASPFQTVHKCKHVICFHSSWQGDGANIPH